MNAGAPKDKSVAAPLVEPVVLRSLSGMELILNIRIGKSMRKKAYNWTK